MAPLSSLLNRNFAGAVSASPDGRWLALGEFGMVRLFDTHTGERESSFDSGTARVDSTTFTTDGAKLLATFRDGPPVLLGRPDLAVLDQPFGDEILSGARFTDDGRYLVVVDSDRRVRLHDPNTFELLYELDVSELPEFIESPRVFTTADDRFIVIQTNGLAQLWALETRSPVGVPFPADAGTTWHAADGQDVVATIVGDHILLWDLDLDRYFEIACTAAGRNMTVEEWERFGPQGQPYHATCPQWPPLD